MIKFQRKPAKGTQLFLILRVFMHPIYQQKLSDERKKQVGRFQLLTIFPGEQVQFRMIEKVCVNTQPIPQFPSVTRLKRNRVIASISPNCDFGQRPICQFELPGLPPATFSRALLLQGACCHVVTLWHVSVCLNSPFLGSLPHRVNCL